jgi:hypothetical protein
MSPLISVFLPHLPTLVSYLYLKAKLSKSPFDEPPTYPIEETSFMDDPLHNFFPIYAMACVGNLKLRVPSVLEKRTHACQLEHRASKFVGAKHDISHVPGSPGTHANTSPVQTSVLVK